jgi:hypothetical protein
MIVPSSRQPACRRFAARFSRTMGAVSFNAQNSLQRIKLCVVRRAARQTQEVPIADG